MRSRHKVCIDEDTKVTYGLDWVDRGPVDELWRPGRLMMLSCCRTPQNLSFVRIMPKSVRLHPAGYSTGAGSEPSDKDPDSVAFSDKLYRKEGTTPGNVAYQLSSRLITVNVLFTVTVIRGGSRNFGKGGPVRGRSPEPSAGGGPHHKIVKN